MARQWRRTRHAAPWCRWRAKAVSPSTSSTIAPTSASRLAPLLEWMATHLGSDLSLERIARRASMSTRTLSRRFREQVGTTPLQWVLTERVRRAQQLLESSDLSVERIATKVGFDSATNLRERFYRVVGTSPAAYRRAFGGGVRLRSTQKRAAATAAR